MCFSLSYYFIGLNEVIYAQICKCLLQLLASPLRSLPGRCQVAAKSALLDPTEKFPCPCVLVETLCQCHFLSKLCIPVDDPMGIPEYCPLGTFSIKSQKHSEKAFVDTLKSLPRDHL